MKLFILIIIFFIFCVVIYYRDIKIRFISPETIAGSYMSLPRVSEHKTVIYFYLTIDTINGFEKTLNSILDQSRRVDYIYVSIDNNIECKIPSYLSKITFVNMQTKENHFRNSILKEKELYVNIIFLNSSKIYKKDFIYTLIQNLDKNTDPVISNEYIYCSPCMFNDSIILEKNVFLEKNINFINFF